MKYTKTAILLHWLTAVLIVAAFVLGLIMTDITGFTPNKLRYFSWHKWLGVTVFGLACLRLLWRLANPAPAHPASMAVWQKRAAETSHVLLYILLFAVPITGYLFTLAAGVPVVYLGIIPLPVFMAPNPELKPWLEDIHYLLNMTMAAIVAVHTLAALKHHFIDRDGILKRMLP